MPTSRRFLFAHFDTNSACAHHRIRLPFCSLEADFPDLDVDLSVCDPVYDYHYYLNHGLLNPKLLPEVGKFKRKGGKWLWSLDDDFLTIPDSNPAKLDDLGVDLWYLHRDLADVILCSTHALADTLDRPEKTLVAPNLFPVADYGTVSHPDAHSGKPLRILWAGTKTHHDDLIQIEEPVSEILKRYPGRVEFIFVGYAPGGLLKRWLNKGVYFDKGVELALYPDLLRRIAPHVVLAPLDDNAFNRSKSNIRVLEGWSLAAAVVASPVGEYRVVRDGVDGLRAGSGAEWYQAMEKLILNPRLRTDLALAGRNRVEDYNWASHSARARWRTVIQELQSRTQPQEAPT